jgi:hypothetical protein
MLKQMKEQIQDMLANRRVMFVSGGVMGSPVTGAPYSADEIRETSQTLTDGTRLHTQTKETVYRDGEGRIRRESPTEIEIWDPLAGANYVLDPKTMTYRKMMVNTLVRSGNGGTQTWVQVYGGSGAGSGRGVGGGMSGGAVSVDSFVVSPDLNRLPMDEALKTIPGSPAKKESLGTRTIEGVNCEGERSTSTIQVGAIGNDRPIVSVNERWYSPELKVTVMTSKSDPRTGTEEFKLTNVRRGEPDPALFQVPAGYQAPGPTKF